MNTVDDAVEPRPLPLGVLVPWILTAAVLALALYLVGFDQGAISRAGSTLHEVMHDGRHVLALPCH